MRYQMTRGVNLTPLWIGREVTWHRNVGFNRYRVYRAYVMRLPGRSDDAYSRWEEAHVGIAVREIDEWWRPTWAEWRNLGDPLRGIAVTELRRLDAAALAAGITDEDVLAALEED